MTEPSPGDPPLEPTPEFWQQVCQEFIDITDELLLLRSKEIEQIMLESQADYAKALRDLDIQLQPEEQPSLDAMLYLSIRETLVDFESHIAMSMTKSSPQDYGITIGPTGQVTEHQELSGSSNISKTCIEEDKIVRYSVDLPEKGPNQEQWAMVLDGLKDGYLPPQALTQEEATGFIRYLKVIRRYVGQELYSREVLPTDPA